LLLGFHAAVQYVVYDDFPEIVEKVNTTLSAGTASGIVLHAYAFATDGKDMVRQKGIGFVAAQTEGNTAMWRRHGQPLLELQRKVRCNTFAITVCVFAVCFPLCT
jgi:hypothetical protein